MKYISVAKKNHLLTKHIERDLCILKCKYPMFSYTSKEVGNAHCIFLNISCELAHKL